MAIISLLFACYRNPLIAAVLQGLFHQLAHRAQFAGNGTDEDPGVAS
jgi:hypothetical protein